ncbi:PVC-type heme-binding CxxCH protein [Oceaniferula spumae]
MTNITRAALLIAATCLTSSLLAAPAKADDKKNTILFYGNSMIERLLEHGELEARLQIANPKAGLKIRSFAWTGDEVGNRLRLEGYAKHMKNLIAEWPAGNLVLGYGFYESFAGAKGLDEFENQYRVHLKQLAIIHPGVQVVMLSPIASEDASPERNADLELYSNAINKLAAESGAKYIDLFSPTRDAYAASEPKLTTRGIHLNEAGNSLVAKVIAEALIGSSTVDPKHLHEVALAASAKHERVAEIVRPKNAVVYFGVRARPQEYADEMPRYHKMIELTEAVVHQLAADPSKKFSDVKKPSLAPMPEGRSKKANKGMGIIKSVAKAQAEFEVDKDYEVNLFASEEQFPELRNPVQIAFDARGRLWVVTMPSFPHTVPGLTPPDKILILEDTDKDGKADKCTTYMEGLDALDGIAFHREGVIISEQPRLWLTRDTDGDGKADFKEELLRGIDVTDSHHGGMITEDPSGDIIFSDGVFHRSQLETPFGIHRGIDATTYRLDVASGKINTEYQHTTPNPWNVDFDRYGDLFQMYGDGIFYDSAVLPWTPLGAYHPFRYGSIGQFGKGSGIAVVSSPNYPDVYQEGMASASLLGKYAVTLTEFDYTQGMINRGKTQVILSSPNPAFRPADLEFGMDGALYVSDFCSPIIGHAQHPMRDPGWDHDYGRIWRVVHKGKPLVKTAPKIEGESPENLCKLLTSPQGLVRHHARIELRKHGAKGIAAVDRWIANMDRNSPDFEQAALEAIFVCGGLNEARPKLIDALLNSKSFHFRGAAVNQIRLQADRLDNVSELLAKMAKDEHPRVLIQVIGAISHLQQSNPKLTEILGLIKSDNKNVVNTVRALDYGAEPVKGRSVPVLEVDPKSELTHWFRYAPGGKGQPVLHTSKKSSGGGVNLFRTFIESEKAQSAIIAINHKALDIFVNGSLKFSQNSLWSGDQQVQVDLQPGVNYIEIELKKGRRATNGLPPVFLYDAVGSALSDAKYVSNPQDLERLTAAHNKMLKERGTVLRVTAAPGLQFAPKILQVEPGAKVRLIFENPDNMEHNWLLIAPGSVAEIGELADKMAGEAGAVEKHYIPDSDKILVHSKLLGPNAKEEIVFTAPEKPGEYPYICTFPGHWRIMQGILTVGKEDQAKPQPGKARGKRKKGKAVSKQIGEGVVFESSATANGFTLLKLPKTPRGKVTASTKTNNDPISILTDGKLSKGFGPIFANGIKDGAYKMDLGKQQPIAAITSWSHSQGSGRGAQTVTIYGSDSTSDPGWKLDDATLFKPLGTISTKGQSLSDFVALSLHAKKGKSLGSYRWIVWKVAPVTSNHENTAFQELAVDVVK